MVSSLHVLVAQRDGTSYLKDAYVTPPFRIVPVGQYHNDSASYLMIMSSSPGILNGDDHRIRIQVEEGAKLQLQSQSYQRLFNMDNFASQQLHVHLAKDSAFSYVPHPIVPHQNASFYSSNEIHLADNCSFMQGEIITSGRKYTGESFQYAHFQNLIEIFYKGRLILKDNVLLQPATMPLQAMGLLEGYTHQGTFIYCNTRSMPVDSLIAHVHSLLEILDQVIGGVSATQEHGFVIRVLGTGGEQLFDFFQKVQAFIWDCTILTD